MPAGDPKAGAAKSHSCCSSCADAASLQCARPRSHPCPPPVQVVATITQFLTEQGLTHLPVYLLGTSSGGTMALKLMQTLQELASKSGVDLSSEPKEGDPFVLRIAGIISGAGVGHGRGRLGGRRPVPRCKAHAQHVLGLCGKQEGSRVQPGLQHLPQQAAEP